MLTPSIPSTGLTVIDEALSFYSVAHMKWSYIFCSVSHKIWSGCSIGLPEPKLVAIIGPCLLEMVGMLRAF